MAGDPNKERALTPDQDGPSEPPYLNEEQQQEFARSFSMNDFEIADLVDGTNVLFIYLPEGTKPLVEIVERGARVGALRNYSSTASQIMQIIESSGEEDLELRGRRALSKISDEMLQRHVELQRSIALDKLISKGLERAKKVREDEIWEMPEGPEQDAEISLFHYEVENIDQLFREITTTKLPGNRPFTLVTSPADRTQLYDYRRYVVFSEGKEVYTQPPNLEPPT